MLAPLKKSSHSSKITVVYLCRSSDPGWIKGAAFSFITMKAYVFLRPMDQSKGAPLRGGVLAKYFALY